MLICSLYTCLSHNSIFPPSDTYPRNAFSKQFAIAGNDGKHLLACSTNGGVLYKMTKAKDGSAQDKLEKVLGLKGHMKQHGHTTCVDWSSTTNDCGPCVTAGYDGQIRVSTLLSQ